MLPEVCKTRSSPACGKPHMFDVCSSERASVRDAKRCQLYPRPVAPGRMAGRVFSSSSSEVVQMLLPLNDTVVIFLHPDDTRLSIPYAAQVTLKTDR